MKKMNKLEQVKVLGEKIMSVKEQLTKLENTKNHIEWSKEYSDEVEKFQPKPIYELIKTSDGVFDEDCGWKKQIKGVKFVVFTRKLLNIVDFDKFSKQYCCNNNMPDKEDEQSVSYYFFNDVLLYESGGYILFKTPQVMTKEQQNKFMNGDADFLKELAQ